MAKIRGFKPDLWTDEDFVEVSPFARLLWMGMWNFACDNGHLQDKSKQIKMRVLPTDDVNCAELLRELENQGLIERADGWITVPNLTHHQSPHKRWWVVCEKPGCEFPEGASYGYSKRESTVGQPLSTGGTTVNNGGSTADVDVDGEVMVISSDGEGGTKKRPHKIPHDWRPNDKHRSLAAEECVDIRREAARFIDYWQGEGKAKLDWDATFRNWLRRAGDDLRRSGRVVKPRVLPSAHDLEQPPDGLTPVEYAAWEADQRARQNA